jgi:hypothetical protein
VRARLPGVTIMAPRSPARAAKRAKAARIRITEPELRRELRNIERALREIANAVLAPLQLVAPRRRKAKT